jgi:hypothetical protein
MISPEMSRQAARAVNLAQLEWPELKAVKDAAWNAGDDAEFVRAVGDILPGLVVPAKPQAGYRPQEGSREAERQAARLMREVFDG